MNKRILFSIFSIVVALGMVGGATYAYFTSTATSTSNVFGAGTLVLHLDDGNETPASAITASFGNSNLKPGDTVSGYISLHNAGSIDIAKIHLTAAETNPPSSPDLAGKLNITTAKIGADSACNTSATDLTSSFTTLAALNSAGLDIPSSSLVASGADKYLCMTFTLDTGTDDTYQGKSITETFTFVGHQL